MVGLTVRPGPRLSLDRVERAVRAITGVTLALALLSAFLSLDPTVGASDGAFEFSVADRLLRGEQLYRDMEFFTTPLSVYWNALLLRFMPRSMVTVSAAVLVSCLVLGLILARRVYRETDGAGPLTALFFFTLMYMGVYRWPRASYSWNAALFVALGAVLLLPRRGPDDARYDTPTVRLFWAGVMLGMATGFKHHIGLVMTAALVLWIVYHERQRADRSLTRSLTRGGAFAVGAALIPGVIILDLSRRGLLAPFVDVVHTRTRQYAQDMGSSFLDNFAPPHSLWSVPNWVLEQLTLMTLVAGLVLSVFLILGMLCAPAALSRVCGGLALPGREPVVMLWAILYVASFVTLYPRPDYARLTAALPLCLTALVVFFRPTIVRNDGRARTALLRTVVAACIALSVPMAAKVGQTMFGLATGRFVVLSAYPAEGMITTARTASLFEGIGRAVREALPGDEPLLIAHPSACFLYPFLGKRPPTSTVFFYDRMVSEADLAELAARIEQGGIRGLLIPTPAVARGRVAQLYEQARSMMEVRAGVDNFHLLVRR